MSLSAPTLSLILFSFSCLPTLYLFSCLYFPVCLHFIPSYLVLHFHACLHFICLSCPSFLSAFIYLIILHIFPCLSPLHILYLSCLPAHLFRFLSCLSVSVCFKCVLIRSICLCLPLLYLLILSTVLRFAGRTS